MGSNRLTKTEALELLTAVVDDEVSAEERKAFMEFIAENDEVRHKYESTKHLKTIIKSRCPYAKAPKSLLNFVHTIRSESRELSSKAPIYDIHCEKSVGAQQHIPNKHKSSRLTRNLVYSAAATVLLLVVVWGFFIFYGGSNSAFNVEEYAYEHFKKHNGRLVPPTISTASLGTAEAQLARDYNIRMTIPPLENAEFMGVSYGEFVPNFEAPLLEYYLPSDDQYIYIFAFQMDKMDAFGQLNRHREAVKKCQKQTDFYIRNVNGKHVVSWKWDNIWYAAISNHDGQTLASLVKPLHYSLTEQ